MLDREEAVTQLREEYWDLQFEMPRPRAAESVQRDQKRIAEIEAALVSLGADVGPRATDMPPHVI